MYAKDLPTWLYPQHGSQIRVPMWDSVSYSDWSGEVGKTEVEEVK